MWQRTRYCESSHIRRAGGVRQFSLRSPTLLMEMAWSCPVLLHLAVWLLIYWAILFSSTEDDGVARIRHFPKTLRGSSIVLNRHFASLVVALQMMYFSVLDCSNGIQRLRKWTLWFWASDLSHDRSIDPFRSHLRAKCLKTRPTTVPPQSLEPPATNGLSRPTTAPESTPNQVV